MINLELALLLNSKFKSVYIMGRCKFVLGITVSVVLDITFVLGVTKQSRITYFNDLAIWGTIKFWRFKNATMIQECQ